MRRCQKILNTRIALIKMVPSHYTGSYQQNFKKTKQLNSKGDPVFQSMVKYGAPVIVHLMDMLDDTTVTKLFNSCTNKNYTVGDLAFLLIDEIEWIPFALVIKMQWCTFRACGSLPDYFWDYLRENRKSFKQNYQTYYYSKERKAVQRSK